MGLSEEIKAHALQLFNENGYKSVTIRMIAEKQGISSGHLNYHFKKRIDLLEKLYFDMVEVFDVLIKELPQTDLSFIRLRNGLEASMKWMIEHKFFWTDLYTLVPLSPTINEHFQSIYENRVRGYNSLINALVDKRLMNSIKSPNEKALFIKNMIDRGNTWLYSAEIYGEKVDKDLLNEQVNRLVSPFLPHLTRKGRKEFHTVFRI